MDELKDCARTRRSRATPGPDGIPRLLIHMCRNSLALYLVILFNYSLHTSRLLVKWKTCKVITFPKARGFNNHVDSLRPITLLNAIEKMLDWSVMNRLEHFCEGHIKLYRAQYGFKKHCSTMFPQCLTMPFWTLVLIFIR